MGQSLFRIYIHLVFGTKRREPILNDAVFSQLGKTMERIVQKEDGTLFSMGGANDHVHLLFSLHSQKSLSLFVRRIKAGSAKWLNKTFEEFGDSFAWQYGYGAFSVSHSNLEQVKEYFSKQQEIHQSKSFREELITLLRLHDIPFDDRYL